MPTKFPSLPVDFPTLHVQLVEQNSEVVQARFWTRNRLAPEVRTLGKSSVQELIQHLADQSRKSSPATLTRFGQSLWQWLNGDDQLVTSLCRQFQPAPPVVVLAIYSDAPDLARLPWELLHDGVDLCLSRAALALVPVRCAELPLADQATVTPPAPRPLGVLFMAASPEESADRPLDFEREEALILQAAGAHKSVTLLVEESGNLGELSAYWTALGDARPEVLKGTGRLTK